VPLQSNRELLARLLRRRGVTRVETYEDGRQCLDAVLAQPLHQRMQVQLWLLDKEMPGIDGFETARTLRTSGVTAPIVGVTGNALPEDQAEFIRCGANSVLIKPCTASDIGSMLLKHGLKFPTQDGVLVTQ
jgi:CheY-like chemotaxis protein